MLTQDEIIKTFRLYKKTKDSKYLKLLLEAHIHVLLRAKKDIIRRYRYQYYDHEDIEGAIILAAISAINSYDNTKSRLSTFLINTFHKFIKPNSYKEVAKIIRNKSNKRENNVKVLPLTDKILDRMPISNNHHFNLTDIKTILDMVTDSIDKKIIEYRYLQMRSLDDTAKRLKMSRLQLRKREALILRRLQDACMRSQEWP